MAGAYRTGILPRALAEVQAIAAWWRKNRPAAPRLFQQELDLALANISERPEIGPKARLRSHPNARTYLLRRTGYEGWLVVEAEQDPRRAPPLHNARLGRETLLELAGV